MIEQTVHRLVACALGLVALVAPATALSQQMWNDGPSRSVTEQDLVPRLSSSEAYIERYNFAGKLDGGGHIDVKFVISNMGWGDLQGAVRIRMKLPTGKRYEYEKKLPQSKWSAADSRLKITIADTTLSRTGSSGFRIDHDGSMPFVANFENRLPMWQPGNGRIEAGDSYYTTHLLAPRARIDGRATVGGETVEFASSSSGFAEHTATNVAPYNMAKQFAWFRNFDDDVTVIWKHIDLTPAFGGGEVTWLLVGYKRRIVYSTPSARLTFGQFKPNAASGYRVPQAVQVESTSGGDSVKFVLRADKYDHQNLMEEWGPIVQAIASSVTNPYRFHVRGGYSFQMTIQGATAKVGGRDHFTMDILND